MKKLLLFSVLIASTLVGFSQLATNGYYTSGSGGSCGGGGFVNMGPPVMTDGDLGYALGMMDRQPFDDDKMRIAEQVVRGHAPSSLQVRALVEALTFESSKLAFAKTAYAFTYDQQNYYMVSEAFTFSCTATELATYTSAIGYSNATVWTNTYGGSSGGAHVCSSTCNHGGGSYGQNGYYNGGSSSSSSSSSSGGSYGQNGYYGGGSSSTTYSGSGTGMTYTGVVTTTPALPMCGGCHGYHEMTFVCDADFGSIVHAVDSRTFDSDRLCMAKQAIGIRFVSAAQVCRLMSFFTFESSKLDFAKWAYSHCWDAQNYYVVNDAFTFSSSIRELDNFIKFG